MVISGEKEWLYESEKCLSWFLGQNDLQTPVYDYKTGQLRAIVGGRDIIWTTLTTNILMHFCTINSVLFKYQKTWLSGNITLVVP